MNYPSIKTLSTIFGDKAKAARQILEATGSSQFIEEFPSTKSWRDSCLYRPKLHATKLHALNTLGDFHGVECAETVDGEWAEYLNAGDTYAGTIIFWRGRYIVQCLGDFVETKERQRIIFK